VIAALRDERAAVAAAVALVLGTRTGERLGPQPATVLLGLGVAGIVAAWLVTGWRRALVVALALFASGAATMARALDGQEHHALTGAIAIGAAVRIDGTAASDATGVRFRTEVLVRDHEADRIVVARGTGQAAGRLRVVQAGDRVVVEGRLAPLPDQGPLARFRWRHAVAVVDGADLHGLAAPVRGPVAFANGVRAVVERGTEALPPDARALTLGFLLGDTRRIPDDVVAAYRASGLSHLLAVSGANVAFVLALAGPLTRRLPLGARTVVALTVVAVFATMTRFEPSVLRASVLAAITVLATFAGRPAAGLRPLLLAVVVLVLADPFLVHSVAFALSVAASTGIVLGARPLASRLPGPALVREPLAVSLAAQVAVTPVLLATFGSVPALGPLANLLAAPAAEALGGYGMVASLLGGVVPPLGAVLQPVTGALTAWVTFVARTTGAAGGDLDRRALVVLGAGALVATLARRARRAVPAPSPR
jgi:competence protein ComEC